MQHLEEAIAGESDGGNGKQGLYFLMGGRGQTDGMQCSCSCQKAVATVLRSAAALRSVGPLGSGFSMNGHRGIHCSHLSNVGAADASDDIIMLQQQQPESF